MKTRCYVSDQEVDSGYNILRSDWDRNGGVANLCFNKRNIFSNRIENAFSQSTNSNREACFDWEFFYRPPNINTFLDNSLTTFCFLGDINVNLLLNDQFIRKENQSFDFRNLSSPLASKYKELCKTFSLKVIIQEQATLPPFLTIYWLAACMLENITKNE